MIIKENKWIQKLMAEVFEKAKTDSRSDSPNALADYLHNEIGVNISERNLIRYYNYYIEKRLGKSIKPEKGSLNILGEYLGYQNFADFIQVNEDKTASELAICHKTNAKLKSRLLLCCIIGLFFAAGTVFFGLESLEKNCMIWVEDHYERVRCSGVNDQRALDKVVLEKMRRIYPCDTTTFFKNGEPIIWYDKSNNRMSYFTYYDLNPINQKTLKPITSDIIEAHIFPCDSIDRSL